jgi:hypothetical protein
MEQSKIRKSFSFHRSGNYRICVKGSFDENSSKRLGGMDVTESNPGNNTTALVGRMRDQAELAGVLNTIYEMHLYSDLGI